MFGKETIIDLHNCNTSRFNRSDIEDFFIDLCDQIDMNREDLHFWDYQDVPKEDWPDESESHLVGTSAIQFITTSNITIHTLDIHEKAYINIFSCKDYDPSVAVAVSLQHFGGEVVNQTVVDRH